MTVSVFDLFSVGIGPSSSHTVGPMRAAARFADDLATLGVLSRVVALRIDLYGALAATSAGHDTGPAILLGLEGYRPESLETDEKDARLTQLRTGAPLILGGVIPIVLSEDDIALHPRMQLSYHPNGMMLAAGGADGCLLHQQTYYSIGGGFVVSEADAPPAYTAARQGGMSFTSAAELLELADQHGLPISAIMLGYETGSRTEVQVRERLLHIRDVMARCVHHGLTQTGLLPGPLRVCRRAATWYQRLRVEDPERAPEFAQDWVNLVALAVNEENAAGGRIVTAPTNGAAGIIPAVLHYAMHYTDEGRADPDGATVRFLLTAGAIGSLYKERASISGAEVGCQGEVGSAASMAAAGLAEILGGTPQQVENAAEIAMEHSLGLTCDPIAGLVQIPCIERNAISAGKAINAARMALRGDGTHRVSLDEVIATMRATGRDMSAKYKETSTGGLAVNVPVNHVEC